MPVNLSVATPCGYPILLIWAYSLPLAKIVDLSLVSATYVQVLEEQSQIFLQVMNSTAIVQKKEVRRLGLIPERVINIKHTSREDANECLLTFLKEEATEEQVLGVFKVASEERSFGRMSKFAADILQRLQRGLCMFYHSLAACTADIRAIDCL